LAPQKKGGGRTLSWGYSHVKFSFDELCSSVNPEKTTGRKPFFGIKGKLKQDGNQPLYRFLLNISQPSSVQTLPIRGVLSLLNKSEENTEFGETTRANLVKFTSAFKETVVFNKTRFIVAVLVHFDWSL
jgi:hypothetical protein